MDLFSIIIVLGIIGVVVSVLGWVIWLVFFVWLARMAIGAAERNLNQLFPDIERMLGQVPQGRFDQMNPQQQAQINSMLLQAQNQFHQLDDLSRQRYETKVSGLMGMAAEAGIHWKP